MRGAGTVGGEGARPVREPPTFDRLSADLARHLGVEAAFIGGVSSGTRPAVHFALEHPDRTLGLLMVQPVYAGAEVEYTEAQAAAFAGMDAIARRFGRSWTVTRKR